MHGKCNYILLFLSVTQQKEDKKGFNDYYDLFFFKIFLFLAKSLNEA